MKKWAVAFISFFDNELTIEFVDAEHWMGAIVKHSKIDLGWYEEIDHTDTLEQVKQWAFDADTMIDVKEIL